jgi:hypothetical protein
MSPHESARGEMLTSSGPDEEVRVREEEVVARAFDILDNGRFNKNHWVH